MEDTKKKTNFGLSWIRRSFFKNHKRFYCHALNAMIMSNWEFWNNQNGKKIEKKIDI